MVAQNRQGQKARGSVESSWQRLARKAGVAACFARSSYDRFPPLPVCPFAPDCAPCPSPDRGPAPDEPEPLPQALSAVRTAIVTMVCPTDRLPMECAKLTGLRWIGVLVALAVAAARATERILCPGRTRVRALFHGRSRIERTVPRNPRISRRCRWQEPLTAPVTAYRPFVGRHRQRRARVPMINRRRGHWGPGVPLDRATETRR